MGRSMYLLLLTALVLGVVRTVDITGDTNCARVRLFDDNFVTFRGLLVQKDEQVSLVKYHDALQAYLLALSLNVFFMTISD